MPSHWLFPGCSAFFVLLLSSLAAFLCELVIFPDDSPLCLLQMWYRFLLCGYHKAYSKHLTDRKVYFMLNTKTWLEYRNSTSLLPCLLSFLMSQSTSFYIVYSLTIVFIMVVIVISNTLVLNLYTIIINTPFYSIKSCLNLIIYLYHCVVNFHITFFFLNFSLTNSFQHVLWSWISSAFVYLGKSFFPFISEG